jgi:hypothetical protein
MDPTTRAADYAAYCQRRRVRQIADQYPGYYDPRQNAGIAVSPEDTAILVEYLRTTGADVRANADGGWDWREPGDESVTRGLSGFTLLLVAAARADAPEARAADIRLLDDLLAAAADLLTPLLRASVYAAANPDLVLEERAAAFLDMLRPGAPPPEEEAIPV